MGGLGHVRGPGHRIHLDGNESFVGRLGLRIGADLYGESEYAKIFAGAGMAEQFEDGSTADVVSGGATLPLSDDIDDTRSRFWAVSSSAAWEPACHSRSPAPASSPTASRVMAARLR